MLYLPDDNWQRSRQLNKTNIPNIYLYIYIHVYICIYICIYIFILHKKNVSKYDSETNEGSLAYAELGTLIPKSGGEYIYYMEAFAPHHRFWGPLLPFLHAWISVNLLRTASTAIAALSFAEYAMIPLMASIGFCDPINYHYVLTRLTASLCICKLDVADYPFAFVFSPFLVLSSFAQIQFSSDSVF